MFMVKGINGRTCSGASSQNEHKGPSEALRSPQVSSLSIIITELDSGKAREVNYTELLATQVTTMASVQI